MGEVYRARDTRLGREVALKVLPADRASDPDRLRRFEQEARAVAALDHPHILALHDLGAEDGLSYVVFELVEGQTLRERLERGALPVRKCVEWGVQICRGLAAAHARGIVHRDLKPENVSVTADGRVKILDFGLAKLNAPVAPEDLPGAQTRTATDAAMVVGTVGYMSPEQVRGQVVDARSDIFSLGAILYEMLTGRRAFQGATPADTVSAILHRDPPEMSAGSGSLPPGLEWVVRRCLEKDADERLQSAHDVALALEALSTTSRPGTALAAWSRRRFVAAAGGGALALASGAAGVWAGRNRWRDPLPTFRRLTFRRGGVDRALFSPDGNSVVYSALWDGNPLEIFSTRLDSPASRSLGLPPARVESVSSRGELAILLARPGDLDSGGWMGTIARVPLEGGEPRPVIENCCSADWSPDGQELAVVRRVDGEVRLEYPIGKVVARVGPSFVRVSPKGDLLSVSTHAIVRLLDRTGKEVAKLPVAGGGRVAWSPRGDGLWLAGSGASASASGFSSESSLGFLTVAGEVRIAYRMAGALGNVYDVARDGRILLHHGSIFLGVKARMRGEPTERDVGAFNWSEVRDISADGSKVLMDATVPGESTHAFLGSARGAPPLRLSDGRPSALSPDGRWAVVMIGDPVRHVLTPVGPGESRPLLPDRFVAPADIWFVGSKQVALVGGEEKGRLLRAFVIDLPGGEPRALSDEEITRILGPTADGDLITVTPHGGLRRQSLAGGASKDLGVSLPDRSRGGGTPDYFEPLRASADGGYVYLRQSGNPARIERLDLRTGRRTPWKILMPDDPAGVTYLSQIVIADDGESYAYTYGRFLQDLYLVDGVR